MTTVLQYVVIAAVIGLVLFAISLFVFGRGEQLAPLPARTSPAVLPEQDLTGGDVRKVRFALAIRGYRMSDVDWTLDRIADELDRTRAELTALTNLSAGTESRSVTDPLSPTATPPLDPELDHELDPAAATDERAPSPARPDREEN